MRVISYVQTVEQSFLPLTVLDYVSSCLLRGDGNTGAGADSQVSDA